MLSYICSYMHVHTCLRILTDAYVEDGYDGLHVCRLEDMCDEPIDEDLQDELQVKRNAFFYCAVYFSLFVSNIVALLVFYEYMLASYTYLYIHTIYILIYFGCVVDDFLPYSLILLALPSFSRNYYCKEGC